MAQIIIPTVVAPFSFDGNPVEGIPAPTADDHAVNREYVTTYIIGSDQIADGAVNIDKLDDIGLTQTTTLGAGQSISQIVTNKGVVQSITVIGGHTRMFGGRLQSVPSARQEAADNLTFTISYTGITSGYTYSITNESIDDTTNFSIARTNATTVTVTYTGGTAITRDISTRVHITATTTDTQSSNRMGQVSDFIDITVTHIDRTLNTRVGGYYLDDTPADNFPNGNSDVEAAIADTGFKRANLSEVNWTNQSGDRIYVAVDSSLQLTGWFSLRSGATNDVDIFTEANGGGTFVAGGYRLYYTNRRGHGNFTAYITVE